MRRVFIRSMLALFLMACAAVLSSHSQSSNSVLIQGIVLDPDHQPVADARVTLKLANKLTVSSTKTNDAGQFQLEADRNLSYVLFAEKSSLRSLAATVSPRTKSVQGIYELLLAEKPSSVPAMEFADNPSFTIAGVTDWTAAGGHGSDAGLRTAETLTTETLALKPDIPVQGMHATSAEANTHRLAAESDERAGNPVGAVQEYERAAQIDPSEQNYFSWASELLRHRAILQSQQVFEKGAAAFPTSTRMLTGSATALFASAQYDEAAKRLCEASALDPQDDTTYLFMGRIEIASPHSLPCVEPSLARFAQQQAANPMAEYLYAMAILKRASESSDQGSSRDAEALLKKAVELDPKCSDAYLQLGILAAARHDFPHAVEDFRSAITSNPRLAEAHYRLGVAYDRIGQPNQAKEEFSLHDKLKKEQAETVERQRREIKQFVIAPPERSETTGH